MTLKSWQSLTQSQQIDLAEAYAHSVLNRAYNHGEEDEKNPVNAFRASLVGTMVVGQEQATPQQAREKYRRLQQDPDIVALEETVRAFALETGILRVAKAETPIVFPPQPVPAPALAHARRWTQFTAGERQELAALAAHRVLSLAGSGVEAKDFIAADQAFSEKLMLSCFGLDGEAARLRHEALGGQSTQPPVQGQFDGKKLNDLAVLQEAMDRSGEKALNDGLLTRVDMQRYRAAQRNIHAVQR